MEERSNKNIMCSVLFLDIVEYSKKSVAGQISLKDRFNTFLSTAIRDVPLSDRIILDTGDGAAINFLGDVEDALRSALSLRASMLNESPNIDPPLLVRMGINLGPVRLVRDINGQPNIVGDGINVAQRVMSFADASQILVSRSYFDAVSRLSPQYAGMFHFQGSRTDKHVREHEVYAIGYPGDKTTQPFIAKKSKTRRAGRLGGVAQPLISLGHWLADTLKALVEDIVALYLHIEPKRRPLFLALVGVPLVLLLAFSLKTLSRIERAAKPNQAVLQPVGGVPESGVATIAVSGVAAPLVPGGNAAQPVVRNVNQPPKKSAGAGKPSSKDIDAAKTKVPKKLTVKNSKDPRKSKADENADAALSKVFGFSTNSDLKQSAKISLRCTRGALLFVDGVQKGRVAASEIIVSAPPGKHVVIVIDPNQKLYSKSIMAESGKTVNIKPAFCK